jgi:uncharacterized membrane protein YebE (DUF533 family)
MYIHAYTQAALQEPQQQQQQQASRGESAPIDIESLDTQNIGDFIHVLLLALIQPIKSTTLTELAII